jgi:hypothetical protein
MTRSADGFSFRALGGDYYLRASVSDHAIVSSAHDPGPDAVFALTMNAGVHAGVRRVRILEPTREEPITIAWPGIFGPRPSSSSRSPTSTTNHDLHAKITSLWERKLRGS